VRLVPDQKSGVGWGQDAFFEKLPQGINVSSVSGDHEMAQFVQESGKTVLSERAVISELRLLSEPGGAKKNQKRVESWSAWRGIERWLPTKGEQTEVK